jgi:RNA-directed DNA polymerase
MPLRHDHLFDRIANFQALHAAARRAVKGKRKKPGAAAFFANLEGELLALERQLRAGIYRPGRYVAFEVNEPKKRIVSAAPFRDRVVHHALCAVVEPIFETGFIDHTFANRIGKGTHRAIEVYGRYRKRHAHVLRCDIYRYFPAIDHLILKADFRRRIACPSTLALLDLIVECSNPQELRGRLRAVPQ